MAQSAKLLRSGASPASRTVLVDSGPLLALFNAADHWHAPVLKWLHAHPDSRLVTTWLCAGEVYALLARRIGTPAALDFLRWAQHGGIVLDGPQTGSLAHLLRIAERYADLPLDLADASIAESAARLRIHHVLTIDTDFGVYRDDSGRPLTKVLRHPAAERGIARGIGPTIDDD